MKKGREVLVTGGVGFIGSHCVVDLLQAEEDYEIILVDNLFNSQKKTIDAIEEITKRKIKKFYQVDLRNFEEVGRVFSENSIEAIVHFAALKAVGESVRNPIKYYQNNVAGTLNLLEHAQNYNVKKFIFSSSATVYGIPKQLPLTEDFPTEAVSPYGSTKLIVENVLRDMCRVNKNFNVILLRYFNPIGAHPSGLIGEDPKGEPYNLFPIMARILLGYKNELEIYGDDYDTPDGTCVRDYVHVQDIASGHLSAIQYLDKKEMSGNECDLNGNNCEIFNLGTGQGNTVLEAVHAMEKASGKKINLKFIQRRPGDVASCFANANRAREILHWSPKYTLEDMCNHLWNFLVKTALTDE